MFVELRERRSSGAIRRGITGRSETKVWPLFVLARKSGNIFDPHKHEEEAIYEINQRNPNVCRIAGAAKQRSNS